MATRYLEVSKNAISLAGARLLVLSGPDRGRAARLDKEELLVGSVAAADLCLTDPTVSRNHFSLRVTERGYVVTDLDSTNGTFLDGHRIQVAHIELGETLDIGATRLRLEAVRNKVSLPLSEASSFGRLLGRSAPSRRLFALLEAVARQDVTVLLVGETGTGKDLAAESLHEHGARARGPFVPLDCGAIPAGLIDSELFGHERGAFTGAHSRRAGAFVEADGGTLFLDEIDKLPLGLQPKLLRALDRREVRPVGSDRAVAVDVRIIAATNRDLRLDVNRGLFREDLYYRLNVVLVQLPPLRERADDIPLLARHFLETLTGDAEAALDPAELNALVQRAWPGNVRELRNHVERMVALSSASVPAEAATTSEPSYKAAKAQAVAAFERQFLSALMLRANGNVTHAARLASMDRVNLIKLLRKFGLGRASG